MQAELLAILHHESLARAGILILANKQARSSDRHVLCGVLPAGRRRSPTCAGRPSRLPCVPQDLKAAMSVEELSSALGLTSMRDHPWHMQPCCALRCAAGQPCSRPRLPQGCGLTTCAVCSGSGLQEGLEWIADRVGRG